MVVSCVLFAVICSAQIAAAGSQQSASTEVRVIRDPMDTVTVEWLSLSPNGVLTSIARRDLPAEDTSTIAIATTPDAWIRFSTPGRSPLTVPAADLQRPGGWRLPELREGGELFLTFEPAAVPPSWYQLTGPFVTELRPRGGVVSLQGLPAGAYELEPVYDGPFKGLPMRLTIASAASTAAVFRHEPAGAAIITADSDACAAAESFSVALGRLREIFKTTDVAACRWQLGGLPRGIYTALIGTANGVGGRRDFTIEVDQTTEVRISAPAVTVSGRVLVNNKPPVKAVLEFLGFVDSPPFRGRVRTTAELRADGSYDVTLEQEGPYVVSLRGVRGVSSSRNVTFERGAHTFDLNIDDRSLETELTIRVSAADPAQAVDVEIRSADNSGVRTLRIPAGETTVTERAVGFGTHRLAARQPGSTSEWEVVKLSADYPAATMDLVLTRGTRSIALRYPDGEAVTSAGFSNTVTPPEEIAPGTYSLATVPPGTELVIRPPSGAPFCKIVHAHGEVEAIALRGRSIILQFENPRISSADQVRISTAAESDCAVPLARFLKTSFMAGPGRSRRVEVLNAPADDLLIVHTPDGAHRLVVPADGLVIVPSAQ